MVCIMVLGCLLFGLNKSIRTTRKIKKGTKLNFFIYLFDLERIIKSKKKNKVWTYNRFRNCMEFWDCYCWWRLLLVETYFRSTLWRCNVVKFLNLVRSHWCILQITRYSFLLQTAKWTIRIKTEHKFMWLTNRCNPLCIYVYAFFSELKTYKSIMKHVKWQCDMARSDMEGEHLFSELD